MVASLGGVAKIILWLLFLSAVFRFFIRLTASYAVNKVNEEVKNKERAQRNTQNERAKQTSGNKTPDSEYVDFVEINDQE